MNTLGLLEEFLECGIHSQLDLHRAQIVCRVLRLIENDYPTLKVKKQRLRDLTYPYIDKHYREVKPTEEFLAESNTASMLAEQENMDSVPRWREVMEILKNNKLTTLEILDKILVNGITSEVDLNLAMNVETRLYCIKHKFKNFDGERKVLINLIEEYENRVWSNDGTVTEELIKESDEAQFIAKAIMDENLKEWIVNFGSAFGK